MSNTQRKDFILPAEPVEANRFLLSAAITQAREGDSIEVYLPSAKEHAEQLVDRKMPLKVTTLVTTFEEV